MISVEEATKIIQQHVWRGGNEMVPLLAAINRVVAEDVMADRDFPPFDRVTMDGIAIAHASFSNGQKKFPIEFVQAAGTPCRSLTSGKYCAEVMTGAMLPAGADTVIRYEDLALANGEATIQVEHIKVGQNVHRQGSDAQQGVPLLKSGTQISAAEIPILASVGMANVAVKSLPRTAIISTGDELIDISKTPEQHQLRKSNVYALAAALTRYSVHSSMFHFQDEAQDIEGQLKEILTRFDLVILSGGVSKGKFDFIPKALESNGIQRKIHQISQRPGKPMWFGVGNNTIVFALPGNPVSTFLCYYRYVEPWLITSLGAHAKNEKVILSEDFTFDAPLTYFLQVKIERNAGRVTARPVPGGGSGDFVNLLEVDGFLELPMGVRQFKAGDLFEFIEYR